MKKLSKQEKYIEKVIKKHGERYDLSKIDYINSTTPVTIICKNHGEFSKIPAELLRDGGCKKCANSERSSDWKHVEEDFKRIHNNKFDYTKSIYINNKTKIDVKCVAHEIMFQVTPQVHRIYGGCPSCRKESYGSHIKLDEQKFTNKVAETHGDRYKVDYSSYKGYNYDLNVNCSLHGDFSIKAKNFLRGSGCPKCK